MNFSNESKRFFYNLIFPIKKQLIQLYKSNKSCYQRNTFLFRFYSVVRKIQYKNLAFFFLQFVKIFYSLFSNNKTLKHLSMKTLQRPKSAILLSLPYNFQSKKEAVEIKQKIKKSLLTFQSESSLEYDFNSDDKKNSYRSYIDNGPSLFNASSHHYSLTQNGKSTNRSLKNSRTQSAVFSKRNQNYAVTGLENYKRLKPCKTISTKSFKNLQDYLQDARRQSNFIERIFQNISSSNQLVKKPRYKGIQKFVSRQKENSLKIEGKNNFSVIEDRKSQVNKAEQTPYKTNVFKPTLQRKSLQVFKRSKAYLTAHG